MPAARLKFLPFLEAARLIDLLEQDPSLLEPGLRIAARRVPVPLRAGGVTLDALAVDASGRCVLVRTAESLSPSAFQEAVTARAWILEALPTIAALCPPLAGKTEVRCLLLTSRVEPEAAPLLSILEAAGIEISEVQAFDSPGGLALSVKRIAPPAAAPAPAAKPRTFAERAGEADRGPDPLKGIPLSAEEAAEFRKISSDEAESPRAGTSADRRAATPFRAGGIPRGASLEN